MPSLIPGVVLPGVVFLGVVLLGVVLAVAAVLALTRAQRTAVGTLVAGAAVWPFIDGPVEGPVLATLAPDHGIHVGDLLALVALAVAAVAARRAWERSGETPMHPRQSDSEVTSHRGRARSGRTRMRSGRTGEVSVHDA